MREEYGAPSTNSPPAQPSAWQLRFGKKSSSRLQPSSTSEANTRFHQDNQLRSPSISEHLLRALDAKPKGEEESNRDCVEALLGRRNAFAMEPELRLRTRTRSSESGDAPDQHEFDHAEVAAEAKEVIRVRLQIESQADSLRHQQRPKRQVEAKYSMKPRSTTPSSGKTMSRRSATRGGTIMERKPHIPLVRNVSDNQRSSRMADQPQRQVLKDIGKHRASTSKVSSKNLRPRLAPPQQLPMERRQQRLQQTWEARKMKAADDQALEKRRVYEASIDNNKEEAEAQRRIQEQIERLTFETQQAAALEERLQQRRSRLQYLSVIFESWHQYVECKRKLQTRVAAEFNWRIMKNLFTHWKRDTHRQRHARAAESARLKLRQQRRINEHAANFHRSRFLPKWFYAWTSFVSHQMQRRVAERLTERRKAQSERLMERLLRQKVAAEESQTACTAHSQSENDLENGEEEFFPANADEFSLQSFEFKTTTSSNLHQRRRAWSSSKERQCIAVPSRTSEKGISVETSAPLPAPPQLLESTSTRTVKRVDNVYEAMEQRAVERKARREQLKQRYEELERQKQKDQEEQRAAREALFLQQRLEEKARIRERKLAEASAEREKQERRDYMITQRYKANKHNRQRLLFYYALLPWRKHHLLNKRVARNACRWHELRVVYSHWSRWLQFVQMRRKVHRRRERIHLQEAARHHSRVIQGRAFRGLVRFHQAIEARALAVRRQTQWNSLQSSWLRWYKRLMDERAYQRKLAVEVATKLQEKKLRRICAQWRKVTCEAKNQHELEREKQQLWRKVRGWLHED